MPDALPPTPADLAALEAKLRSALEALETATGNSARGLAEKVLALEAKIAQLEAEANGETDEPSDPW